MRWVRRRRSAIGAVVASLSFGAIGAVALGAPFTVPIPGVSSRQVQSPGALRTDDGGAVLAVRLSRGSGGAGRLVLARLQADGALNLAYGSEGLSTIPVDARFDPTALAIDPSNGAAWVGGHVGSTGEVVAVDGSGHRLLGFGRHGVLRLPTADAGGPAGLAWRDGALLIAAGQAPCRGCSLSLLDPRSGRLLASGRLSAGTAAGGCLPSAITAAVFAARAGALLSTRAAPGCPAALEHLDAKLRPVAAATNLPVPAPRGSLIAGDSTAACIAARGASGWEMAPAGAGGAPDGAAVPAGAIIALVPLGPGACATLVNMPGRGAVVAQMAAGTHHAVTNGVPRGLAPVAMFRCHAHLLVVATEGGQSRQAVIYPVPVRRGRFARAAASASRAQTGTGCAAGRAAKPFRASQLPLPGPAASPTSLALTRSLGWIGADLTGQPGASVEISEIVGSRAVPVETVTLPASGSLTIAHFSEWLCTRRHRAFSAQATDGSSPAATAAIATPSCERRLRLAATPRHARAGTRVSLRVIDTWGIGGASFALCTTPPASIEICDHERIAPRRRAAIVRLPVPAPGMWDVSLRPAYGRRVARSIAAEHAGDRISMLATGDSEIQEVDTDLATGLANRRVRVTSDARVGTGISKVAQFDWVRHAQAQAASLRPDETVVFIGANDGFSLPDSSGAPVPCCGPRWIELFAARSERMMAAYRRSGRGRVFWFTLPIARDAQHADLFRAVNRAYVEAAASFHGQGVELIRADRIFTPGGRYRQYMDYRGRTVDVRAPDGIHLSPAGAQIAAAAVIAALRAGRVTS